MKVYVVKKNGTDVKTFKSISAAMRFAGVIGGSVEVREVAMSEIEGRCDSDVSGCIWQ
jgi:hypothetical protein